MTDLVVEPSGRFAPPPASFSAVRTIGRGLEEAPILRQGLGVTWMLAIVGAVGRVVVPILLQQAIDRGIVGDEEVRVGFVGEVRGDRRRRPRSSPGSPSAKRSCASAHAARRRCSTCAAD